MSVKIFYTQFNAENKTAILTQWLSFLPIKFRDIISRYKLEEDKTRKLLGRLLLIEGMRDFGIPNISLEEVKYNPFGKPYLYDHIDFNISHSGNYIFCAIAEGLKVGIDIEELKPINFSEMHQIMNATEWLYIRAAIDPLREFYRMWTLKEAALKAEGTGFLTDPDKVCVKKDIVHIGNNNWFCHELFFDTDYSGHLVTSETQHDYKMIKLDFI